MTAKGMEIPSYILGWHRCLCRDIRQNYTSFTVYTKKFVLWMYILTCLAALQTRICISLSRQLSKESLQLVNSVSSCLPGGYWRRCHSDCLHNFFGCVGCFGPSFLTGIGTSNACAASEFFGLRIKLRLLFKWNSVKWWTWPCVEHRSVFCNG